jgi:hypothetical protein
MKASTMIRHRTTYIVSEFSRVVRQPIDSLNRSTSRSRSSLMTVERMMFMPIVQRIV